MSIDISLSSVLSTLAMGGIGLIGFFMRRSWNEFDQRMSTLIVKFDAASEKFSDQAIRLAVLEEKVKRLEDVE